MAKNSLGAGSLYLCISLFLSIYINIYLSIYPYPLYISMYINHYICNYSWQLFGIKIMPSDKKSTKGDSQKQKIKHSLMPELSESHPLA